MTEINQTSQQSLQRILDKLGVKSSEDKKVSTDNKSTLGQEDFLKLMTTQLTKSRSFCSNGKWRFYSSNGTIFYCYRNN